MGIERQPQGENGEVRQPFPAHHQAMLKASPLAADHPDMRPRAEVDTKNAEALGAALNKSAERIQTLWFTFLGVTVYFALTVGGTTHRMLLLGEGLKLPVVDIQLPLLSFYIVAPMFYVVLHAYFLMMLVLLARTAWAYVDALEQALPGPENEKKREDFRMRSENSIFLQIICGAKREREGTHGYVLRTIARLSLAATPILLLLLFQLMFLPYHHPWVTTWHRLLVAADLVLVWTLWGSYLHRKGEWMLPLHSFFAAWAPELRRKIRTTRWRVPRRRELLSGARRLMEVMRRNRRAVVRGVGTSMLASGRMVLSLAVIVFSLAMATWPGEQFHGNSWAKRIDDLAQPLVQTVVTWRRITASDGATTVYDGHRLSALLFGYEMPVRDLSPDKRGLFPNRLWLPNETLADDEKMKRLGLATQHDDNSGRRQYTIDAAGRDFTGAVFIAADLRQADLQNARVGKANFSGAWLEGTLFEVKDGRGAVLDRAIMYGASLRAAELQGASFGGTQLQGAVMDEARLQGAIFWSASLSGASLNGAHLQGATFHVARLQMVSLNRARLQGAQISGTDFRGTSFHFAQLQGADFIDLPGLATVRNEGAVFTGAAVWRSTIARSPGSSVSFESPDCSDTHDVLDSVSFGDWLADILAQVPAELRSAIQGKLMVLDKATLTPGIRWSEEECREWRTRAGSDNTQAYIAVLAQAIEEVGCSYVARPHVLRGLKGTAFLRLALLEVGADRPEQGPSKVHGVFGRIERSARAKPDERVECPGARGLTEADLLALSKAVELTTKTRGTH